jgi:hypothetical protein
MIDRHSCNITSIFGLIPLTNVCAPVGINRLIRPFSTISNSLSLCLRSTTILGLKYRNSEESAP